MYIKSAFGIYKKKISKNYLKTEQVHNNSQNLL